MTGPSIFRNPRLNINDKTSIHKIDNTPRVYTLSPSTRFFQSGILDSSRPVYTSLDTATDDYGHPIAISAFRFQYDNNGNVRIIDSYRRYYEAHNWDMRSTQEHHNFTSSALNSLRKQQHATYSKQYDARETASLQKYLGKSVIVGYGVHQFDFNNLFPYTSLPNSTIDLRAAARNIWPDKNSKLKNVFPRVLGNTMEQKGLLPSNPDASSLANIMLLDKMRKYPGEAGEAIRYVMNTPEGRQLAEKDPYLENSTMVVKGTYKAQFDRHRLNEVYMTEEELKAAREEMAGYLNNIESNGGVGEEAIPLTKYEMEEGDISPAVLEALAWMKTQQKHQGQESLKKIKVKVKARQSSPLINNSTAGQELFQEFNQFNNYRRLGLVRQLAGMGELEGDALLEAAGYTTKAEGYIALKGMAAKLHKAKKDQELKDFRETVEQGNWKSLARDLSSGEYSEKYGGWATGVEKYTPWTDKESPYTGSDFDRDEALRKMRYLDKAQKRGDITVGQRASLDGLIGSYDELVDATEDVIEANQKLEKTYKALASIKPYDINNLIGAAHGQWSGIKGAARGVVPNFVLRPLSRLGDAAMNSIDRSVSPWNAFNRTFNAVVGPFMGGGGGAAGMGGAGGVSKFKAGMGIFNAGTQIVGNYAQARVEMKGLEIQNTLNTLGAMISWISTPFQLLHKAAKLLIGSFTGLSLKLNGFMASGIGLMSQMGNPLTELTGVNYNAYAGSTMMDIASLFGKGSMNSIYEDFATQQQGLLFGNINTQRMIAASMLGGFEDIYMSRGDSMSTYNAMANKLLANMQGQSPEQRKQTMYLAGQIDKNLPSLLRTANLLGVTDINQLADPSKRGMYWNTPNDAEASRFRWTQYEFGAAREQMGYSKMRLANSLWNAGGRKIYNAFNELVDAAATGNWSAAIDKATDMWNTFKEKVTGVWDAIKKSIGGEEGNGENKLVGTFKTIGALITNVAIDVAMKILDIWGDITNKLASKVQGLVSYLSTISLKPHWDWKNGLSFRMESIDTAETPKGSTRVFKSIQGAMVPWDDRTKGYASLVNALFPNMSDEEKRTLTRDKLADKLHHLPGIMKDGVLDTPELNLPEYGIQGLNLGHNPELIEPLLDMLGKADSKGPGWRLQASAYSSKLGPYINKEIYDATGIGGAVKEFNDFTLDTTRTTLQGLYNDNTAKVELWFKDDSGKKALIAADSKGSVLSKNLTLLSQMVPEGLKLVVNQLR